MFLFLGFVFGFGFGFVSVPVFSKNGIASLDMLVAVMVGNVAGTTALNAVEIFDKYDFHIISIFALNPILFRLSALSCVRSQLLPFLP